MARTGPGTLTTVTRPVNAVINEAKATTSRGAAPAVEDVLVAVAVPVAVAGAEDVADDFPPAFSGRIASWRPRNETQWEQP